MKQHWGKRKENSWELCAFCLFAHKIDQNRDKKAEVAQSRETISNDSRLKTCNIF